MSHTTAVSPSARQGMGTILYVGGAAFRVWAPFASSVCAAGTFNAWSPTANPFASEGNGYWSVDVPGINIGDEYQFVITNGTQPLIWHKNPYASEVVSSSGNAIVHDPNFDWTGDNFRMPPWNELVIYEMHVASFDSAPGSGPGTFVEIIPQLPYLKDLGINAIEIMPVAEFSGDYSWGYNPSQPFAVESLLGGPQGLYQFIKAAHTQGIAVILDVVTIILETTILTCGSSTAGRMPTTTEAFTFTTMTGPRRYGVPAVRITAGPKSANTSGTTHCFG